MLQQTLRETALDKKPNLLKGDIPRYPEDLLVSYINYVQSDEGVYYLSLLTAPCNRKVMCH